MNTRHGTERVEHDFCKQVTLKYPEDECTVSRVEKRRNECSLPVVSRLGFRLITAVRFGLVCFLFPLIEPDWPISRIRLSEKATLSPTEGSRSGVVTGPSHTQSSETPPENVCMPAAAPCVCRVTTDAAFCGHAYRPHCRTC